MSLLIKDVSPSPSISEALEGQAKLHNLVKPWEDGPKNLSKSSLDFCKILKPMPMLKT